MGRGGATTSTNFKRMIGCSYCKGTNDLRCKKFGRLTALEFAGMKGGNAYWYCICDCNPNTVPRKVARRQLERGQTKSCGCLQKEVMSRLKRIDYTGQYVGRLYVLGFAYLKKWASGGNTPVWRVRCSCLPTRIFNMSTRSIRFCMKEYGTVSCGCFNKEQSTFAHFGKTGDESHNWKGGRILGVDGYVKIYAPNHPSKENGKYILEHRLVMEEHLGRFLENEETVHHKNGIRDDNRLENLELWASKHPPGQRVKDLLKYAREIIEEYGEEEEECVILFAKV